MTDRPTDASRDQLRLSCGYTNIIRRDFLTRNHILGKFTDAKCCILMARSARIFGFGICTNYESTIFFNIIITNIIFSIFKFWKQNVPAPPLLIHSPPCLSGAPFLIFHGNRPLLASDGNPSIRLI